MGGRTCFTVANGHLCSAPAVQRGELGTPDAESDLVWNVGSTPRGHRRLVVTCGRQRRSNTAPGRAWRWPSEAVAHGTAWPGARASPCLASQTLSHALNPGLKSATRATTEYPPSSVGPCLPNDTDTFQTSALQREAILALVGPSSHRNNHWGSGDLPHAAAGLAVGVARALHLVPQSPTHLSDSSTSASKTTACVDAQKRQSMRLHGGSQAQQQTLSSAGGCGQEATPQLSVFRLHAACLASVAAAMGRMSQGIREQAEQQHQQQRQSGQLWAHAAGGVRASLPSWTSTSGASSSVDLPRTVLPSGSSAPTALGSLTAAATASRPPSASCAAVTAAAAGGAAAAAAAAVAAATPSAAKRTAAAAAGGAAAAAAATAAAVAAATGRVQEGAHGGTEVAGRRTTAAAVGGATKGIVTLVGGEGAKGAGSGEGQAEGQVVKQAKPPAFADPIRYAKLLFSGAMSAVVSRTCVAPLERVKMDLLLKNGTGDAFTTAAQVLRTEGITGFWKGNALNVLRTAPFKAVNFFSFDMYHAALMALSGLDGNFERFAAGACAGVTATLVCFPLDVVRTRLMASVAGPRYGPGPFRTLSGILRNEGAGALYSGCLPAVIGMAPAGAVFYGVYDWLKHNHLEHLRQQAVQQAAARGEGLDASAAAASNVVMDPVHTLLFGALAGAASELIVYPLEVIRRKMQLQSMALAGLRLQTNTPSAAAAASAATAAAASAAAGQSAATTCSAAAAAAAAAGGASASGAAATAAAAAPVAAHGIASAAAGPGVVGGAMGHHGATSAVAAAAAAAGGRIAAAAAHAHPPPLPHGGALGHLAGAAHGHLLPPQALAALLGSGGGGAGPASGLARIAAAVAAIIKADGPKGFYSGLLPNMLQVLPSAALSYYTYDTLKTVLGAR